MLQLVFSVLVFVPLAIMTLFIGFLIFGGLFSFVSALASML